MLMHFLLMTAKADAAALNMELPEAAAQAMVHLMAGLHSEIIGFMDAKPDLGEVTPKESITGYGKRWSQAEIDRFEVELVKGLQATFGNMAKSLCHDVWHSETNKSDFPCPTCNEGGS